MQTRVEGELIYARLVCSMPPQKPRPESQMTYQRFNLPSQVESQRTKEKGKRSWQKSEREGTAQGQVGQDGGRSESEGKNMGQVGEPEGVKHSERA